jgi:hypothetical protein
VLGRYREEIDRGLGDTVLPSLLASIDEHMGGCWEDAFRDHLRRRAATIHPETVAIGPWWRAGGQDQIDAVVLATRAREPVLVGEAKWSRSVNGGRIAAQLAAKAGGLTDHVDDVRFAICARSEVTSASPDALVVTASDIFTAA